MRLFGVDHSGKLKLKKKFQKRYIHFLEVISPKTKCLRTLITTHEKHMTNISLGPNSLGINEMYSAVRGK